MKYIKLFENFNSNDMLEEAKWILINHLGEIKEIDIRSVDANIVDPMMSDDLINRIRVFELLGSPNVKDLKGCEAHLEAETEGIFWNVNLDWYRNRVCVVGIGESIEEFCLEWLRERFDNAERYEKENQVFYLDKDKDGKSINTGGVSILYYYENDGQDKYCYINQQKIWSFLTDKLGLEDSQVRSILSKWLIEKFDITAEPKKW